MKQRDEEPERRRRVTKKSGSGYTTFPPGIRNDRVSENNRSGEGPQGGVLLHLRLPDATKTEDRKSLGTIKVSRRVRERAVKTGHFSNGMMAAHKLCKLLSLRQAAHPVNDNYRRERGSGDTEHRDICVRIRYGRTDVTARIRALASQSEFLASCLQAWIHCWECRRPTLRQEGSDGSRNASLGKKEQQQMLPLKKKV